MKSKNALDEYAPWELEGKEPKKGEKKRSIPAKSSQKSRVRSKPKTRDQDYLDLYLMAREKERLESYGRTLGERQKAIAQTWKEVKSTMFNKKKELPLINKEGIEDFLKAKNEKKKKKKKKKQGNLQTIDWNY